MKETTWAGKGGGCGDDDESIFYRDECEGEMVVVRKELVE